LGVGRVAPDCRYPSHQGCGEVGSCRRLHGRKLAKLAANPFDGSDSLSSEPSLLLPVSGASAAQFPRPRLACPDCGVEVESGTTCGNADSTSTTMRWWMTCARTSRARASRRDRSAAGRPRSLGRIPSTEEQDRREILLHLRVWQIINPAATAARRDAGDDASQGPL